MFIVKKKSIIAFVLVLTFVAFLLCFGFIIKTSAEDGNSMGYKIVIDAGHGGIDAGVSGVKTGVKESELNLKVTKKLEKYLVDAGFSVVLTRKTDAGLYGVATSNLKRKDMLKRKEIILEEKPTLVISIHMNKYSVSTRRGAQVFYKSGDEFGKILAHSIQNNFNLMESASRECSALVGDYYILNCSSYPSVIAECGFLSNPEDEALLIQDEYQNELAYTIFKGIIEYFSQCSFKFCY